MSKVEEAVLADAAERIMEGERIAFGDIKVSQARMPEWLFVDRPTGGFYISWKEVGILHKLVCSIREQRDVRP